MWGCISSRVHLLLVCTASKWENTLHLFTLRLKAQGPILRIWWVTKKKRFSAMLKPSATASKAALMHINPNTMCDIFWPLLLNSSFWCFFPFYLFSCNLSLFLWFYNKLQQKYSVAQLWTETFSSFPDLQCNLCIYIFHCSPPHLLNSSLVFAKKLCSI